MVLFKGQTEGPVVHRAREDRYFFCFSSHGIESLADLLHAYLVSRLLEMHCWICGRSMNELIQVWQD